MAGQQQQMQISQFGITPIPTPTQPNAGDKPDGRSPNAKRPLDRASIAVASSGVRPMTNDDLSAGFMNLHQMQERDQKWTQSIAESVHYNAGLTNAMIDRLNALEAGCKLMTAGQEKLEEDIKVALNAGNEKMVEQLGLKAEEQQGKDRENALRAELNAMTV